MPQAALFDESDFRRVLSPTGDFGLGPKVTKTPPKPRRFRTSGFTSWLMDRVSVVAYSTIAELRRLILLSTLRLPARRPSDTKLVNRFRRPSRKQTSAQSRPQHPPRTRHPEAKAERTIDHDVAGERSKRFAFSTRACRSIVRTSRIRGPRIHGVIKGCPLNGFW